MEKTKLKTSYYGEPTPKWFRILGDFLNYVSASASITMIVENNQTWAIVFIVVGALGKAITNAFTTVEVES